MKNEWNKALSTVPNTVHLNTQILVSGGWKSGLHSTGYASLFMVVLKAGLLQLVPVCLSMSSPVTVCHTGLLTSFIYAWLLPISESWLLP